MADFEQAVEQAVAHTEIPGCVLQATNRDGSFTYNKCFGNRSVDPDGDRSPLNPSVIMWIASCTKLMTSICALQLVERGELSLDDPVYNHIPELKDHPVLKGFSDEDGSPMEEPHSKPITLRSLLTHSSGFSYDGMHPTLLKYNEVKGRKPSQSGKLLERFLSVPMLFNPGESWMYGPGIDFAGLLIERISGKTLQEFMDENLWTPLGIKDMTFHLSKRPDLKERLADMSQRDPSSGKVIPSTGQQIYQKADGSEIEDCMGGQGVFTSAEEYIKVLQALLTADQDGSKIFQMKETVELFFSKQLGQTAKTVLNMITQDPAINNAFGGVPSEIGKDWGLGGLVIDGDKGDGMREGTMLWGGLPNLIWSCDRKAGLVTLYAGQVVPPGDAKCAELTRKFQQGMYALYGKSQAA